MLLPSLLSLSSSFASPNVLFVLADDLGFNELNFMNATRGIKTPHLDELAHAGVILRNYYVQPICSPTRSALVTGRYPIRLGTQASVIYWDTPWGLPINETLVPQNLKQAGYNTAMFGKWHLGMFKQEYTPARRGFDEHMGYYQGCGSAYTHVASCCTAGSVDDDQSYVCPVQNWSGPANKDYRGYDWFATGPAPNSNTSVPVFDANHTNSAWLIRDAAKSFISRQSAKTPWFLFLPFQNVHSPYTADPKYWQMYSPLVASGKMTQGEQTMFAYLTEMDDAVGEVVATMNGQGFTPNTVVIFSSDNGAPPAPDMAPPGHGNYIPRNYPYRGWKTQIWEGGTRVAGFISSPLLPAAARGTVHNGLFHVTDWLPTIVGLAGGSTARNHPLDGHDIWESVTTRGPSPRDEVLYNVNPLCDVGQAGPPKAGLRIGQFKLLTYCYNVTGRTPGAEMTGPVPGPAPFDRGYVMYDLDADPSETTDIARRSKKDEKMAKKLLARLKVLAESMVEPMQWTPPFQGPDYFCADCPLHPGGSGPTVPWGPWL